MKRGFILILIIASAFAGLAAGVALASRVAEETGCIGACRNYTPPEELK